MYFRSLLRPRGTGRHGGMRRQSALVPWLIGIVVMVLVAGVGVAGVALLGGSAEANLNPDTEATTAADRPTVTDESVEDPTVDATASSTESAAPEVPPEAEAEAAGDASASTAPPKVIQDTDRGTGADQVEFSDGWKPCTTTCELVPDGSYQWTSKPDTRITVRFSGSAIALYGVKEPWSRIATVAIDGGTPVEVDFYSADQHLTQVYESRTLPDGDHTLVLAMTADRNAASTGGDAITFDRAEVYADADAAKSAETAKPAAPAAPAPAEASSQLNSAGTLSGLPWMSGVWENHVLDKHTAFGAWRGRPTDVAHVFTVRNNWNELTEPDVVNKYKAFPGKLIISQPMYPKDQGNNKDCAAGKYDEYWKKFGAFLVARNRADSIVRIGWEFNGTFFYWHVDADPTAWKECFRKVATAIRSTDPKVIIDWTINAHASPVPSSHNPYDAYPGDEFVDIVGIDSYDHTAVSKDEASWNRQCNDVNGLCTVFKFARDHGKKAGVGEWSAVSCGTNGPGGDNPFYIQKMFEAFKANADVLAYEAYYEEPAAGNVCSTIMNGGQNPAASAKYRSLYAAQ